MATIAQIEANRLNAQKSTGPRSAEGKASSRFNALKHGADARAHIIPGEDEADLLNVTREYYEEFHPEGVVETELVDTLVRCHWEKRRVPRLEAAAIQALVSKQENSDHALGAAIIADASAPMSSKSSTAAARPPIATGSAPKATSAAARPSASPAPPIPTRRPLNRPPPIRPRPAPPPARNEPNPAPSPNPQPLTPNPQPPPSFNPRNPDHPPIELCPSCNSMGRIHDRCYFQPREPRK